MPIVHCVLSAAFHDGEGPVYGVVDGVLDGKAMVKYVNETGLDAMVEVNEASILTGDDVEEQWVNGKPAELRYRYSLVPVEEEVAHWRLCQVEKIEQGGDGVHMAVFRVKNDNEGVMKMSVDEYRDLAISVSKEDFILGIGDKTGMDVSDGEMKAALDATDRREARLNHPTMSSVKLVGRFGFVERTTLEGHHRWLKRNNEDEEGSLSDEDPVLPVVARPQRSQLTFGQANEQAEGSRPNLELPSWETGTFSLSPRSTGLATPQVSPLAGVVSTYCKYDYNPRQHYKHRSTMIFAGGEFALVGVTPAEQLESLRSQEIIPSPGSDIGHYHATYCFAFGELPLGLFNVRFIGGGQNRTLEESNTNKAIIASMKKRDMVIKTIAEVSHTTMLMMGVFRRWYRPELIECMHLLDEFARKAVFTEGVMASRAVVGSYVSLLEIALRVICTGLNGLTPETFVKGMEPIKVLVRETIALHSETYALTIGVTRAEDFEKRLQSARGSGGGGSGGGGHGSGGERPAKQPKGGAAVAGSGNVPRNVVAALKNKDGKALCVGFLAGDSCTRKPGQCRFSHEPFPEGVAQDVKDWVALQTGGKS